MAQNPLPKNPGALIVMATKAKPGLVKYGAALGITQVTLALLDTDSGTLADAITAFNATRVGRTSAHGTLNTASAAAKTFLTGARGILLPLWGDTFSQQWAAAGWTDNSTAVPNNQPGRLALVQAIAGFLKANPTMEATTPGVTFTQAQANAVAGALSAGLTGVGTADATSNTARDTRATADKTLRGDLRTLIAILNDKLTPNDPRWAEFGLNAPGAAVTPQGPGASAKPRGGGGAALRDVRRAARRGPPALVDGKAGADGFRQRGRHGGR